MRGFRAKDADRDRHVEVIEAAYVDGQIGDADRELRVSRALSAETLDELESLTRDLQPPAGLVPSAGRSGPARTSSVPGRLVGGLVALVAVVVLLGAGALALVLFSASEGSESGSPVEVASEQAAPAPSQEVAEAPAFEMTPAGVRAFVRGYEAEFGTLDVLVVGFYPTRVGAQVPVRGSRPRSERWTWTGSWTQDTQAAAVTGPTATLDLDAVDVRRLFANIATARRTLDVQRGRLTHVLLNSWSGTPTANIYIGNDFGETGYLKTTLAGDVVRAFPYGG